VCGRYILRAQAQSEKYWVLNEPPQWFVSYNIAPSTAVPVVRSTNGVNEGPLLRWGLVPFFARGEIPRFSTINARVETIETAASYRGPWQRGQRCILVASGFYEWQLRAHGKQPYFIHVADREHFGFAGLWDRSFTPGGVAIESCTIITVPASPLLAEIHNSKKRMPAILRESDHEAWIRGTAEEAKAALIQYPDEQLTAYPVSPRVNSPKYDEPSLIEPVETEVGRPHTGDIFGDQ
jgi:putative SOS response-associated peptidase YedK